MAYRIEYSPTAQEEFRGLPRADAEHILSKMARLEAELSGNIKRLQGADMAYRLRIGDYRILFDVAGDRVIVCRVGSRKDVYD